jgi:coenzyme PQQ synthesis protein D (PqqD)
MAAFRVNEPQIIHQTVDDETVVVDLGTGSYFSLRGSAQVIWSALERGQDLPDVVRTVQRRFEGVDADIAPAVEAFVSGLVDDKLIVPNDEAPPASPAAGADDPSGARGPFEAPVLERFDDLQDLILLDPVHEVSEEQGWPHARPSDAG